MKERDQYFEERIEKAMKTIHLKVESIGKCACADLVQKIKQLEN